MTDDPGTRKSRKFPLIKKSYFKKLISVFKRKNAAKGNSLSKLNSLPVIQQVTQFATTPAAKTMFPRNEIIAVDKTAEFSEIQQLFHKHRVNSIIIYESSLDHVLGQIQIHDVINIAGKGDQDDWHQFIKPVILVTANIPLLELSLKLYYTTNSVALIVDEYGGIDGIINQDQIAKNLFKRISTHNRSDVSFTKMSDNIYHMSARIKISELEEALGVIVADKINPNCETLGGLVTLLAGKVPNAGEKVLFPEGNMEFSVLETDLSRVKRVAVKLITSE